MLDNLGAADRAALTQVLVDWRAQGVENPTIPLYNDVDGDGIPDLVGLDESGGLVLVPGATVESSVAVSTGGGDA